MSKVFGISASPSLFSQLALIGPSPFVVINACTLNMRLSMERIKMKEANCFMSCGRNAQSEASRESIATEETNNENNSNSIHSKTADFLMLDLLE